MSWHRHESGADGLFSRHTGHRFLIHDRDAIYAQVVERAIRSMGLRVLKTPVQTPQANGFCERLNGMIRRECLDWLIPLHQPHLRQLLTAWVAHDTRGRPHAILGPGIPEPSAALIQPEPTGHRLPTGSRVIATPILNGLHHEYHLVREPHRCDSRAHHLCGAQGWLLPKVTTLRTSPVV